MDPSPPRLQERVLLQGSAAPFSDCCVTSYLTATANPLGTTPEMDSLRRRTHRWKKEKQMTTGHEGEDGRPTRVTTVGSSEQTDCQWTTLGWDHLPGPALMRAGPRSSKPTGVGRPEKAHYT